jgi:hypothetical protein
MVLSKAIYRTVGTLIFLERRFRRRACRAQHWRHHTHGVPGRDASAPDIDDGTRRRGILNQDIHGLAHAFIRRDIGEKHREDSP